MAKAREEHREHPQAKVDTKAEAKAHPTLVESGNPYMRIPDHYKVGEGGRKFEVKLPNAIVYRIDAESEVDAVQAYDLLAGVIGGGDQSHEVVELVEKSSK